MECIIDMCTKELRMTRLSVYDMLCHHFADYLAGDSKPAPLAGIDLEKEYKLIQQKKSKCSSNVRRMIVLRYERLIKEGETK